MVWIQAGFAMVVLSAAIKAIPAEIVEAARLDGANAVADVLAGHAAEHPARRSSSSWSPSPSRTLKVFDIVRTMTNGNFDTNVHRPRDVQPGVPLQENGQGSALAVFLFILVIPIVIYQIRSLRRQREVR